MIELYQNLYTVISPIKKLVSAIFFIILSTVSYAQCPPNIDFELGNFTGWQCYTGGFTGGTPNPAPTLPIPGRHDMLSTFPGDGRDPYGNFPKNCPNGSGHSIKIGNESTGGTSDKVSYTFTIPVTQNKFSLIYNYAVVLNDFNHPASIQPRLTIEIKNLTDNTTDPCSSFDFVINSSLPGFFTSFTPGPGNTPVRCKDWSAASINLDGNAGKTIEISFTTTGCGQQAHFGYAYIDVNTQCGTAFTGATFCPDDTAVNVTAPFGYQSYRWFNNNFSQVLGTQQVLTLNPPPLSGDSVFVELTPYNGYGCLDTLSANLWDTLTVNANAGPDIETCDNIPVQLGGPPTPGLLYRWTPVTGLNNPNISNPIATPGVTTQYTLTVTNNGGGCATPDVVNVNVDILSDSIELIGVATYCTGNGQSATLKVFPADSIQWFKDNIAITGANQTILNITQTGSYFAMLFSSAGCSKTTAARQINIYETPVANFGTNAASQCFNGHQFVYTNQSSISTGVLQYLWDLGDGNIDTARDVIYSYLKEGDYKVKLLVTAPGGCIDSSELDVKVNPSPDAAFAIDIPEQCFKNNWFIFSNKSTVSSGVLTYNWDFGDGTFDNSNDIAHKYLLPDTFMIKLTAIGVGGCQDDSLYPVIVYPSPNIGYSVNNNPQCFPGHQFIINNSSTISSGVLQYQWDMGDGTKLTTADVNYSYVKAGNYKIKLLLDAAGGCKDSLSQDLIVHPTPLADFTVKPVCENLRVPVFNRTYNNTNSTINYAWDFDNGHLDNVKTPVYSYPVAGTYNLKLTVSTAQCPASFDTKTVKVTIDAPAKGITYPVKDAAFNFNEKLQARPIGNSVVWTPSTNLSNRFSFTPDFYGLTEQLYTIEIKTPAGCLTVDTQLVKTHKKIEIYVPTGFTPDGNGINERLRPFLIGFVKVNHFRIYDRWGKLLYSMNSDQPGWDGRISGKPADLQTVVWMIEAVDVDGKVHNKQGTTVLIR